MARLLVTYLDLPSAPKKSDAAGPASERWMALERAQRGSFSRVVVFAARDFHWERLLADDYGANGFAGATADATPTADGSAPAAEPAAEASAPEVAVTPAAPEASESAAPEAVGDSESDAHDGTAVPSDEELEQAAADAGLDNDGDDDEAAPAAPSDAPAEAAATEGRARRAPRPRKAPTHVAPKDRAELLARLEKMRAGGNPDVGALACVATGIGERFGLGDVACRTAPGHVREKDQATLVRMLALAPRSGESVTIDLADAPRPLAAIALVAGHAVYQARPDVSVDDVWFDRSTGAPQSAKPMLDLLRQQAILGDAARGRATFGLVSTVAREPMTKALLPFAHRIQVATGFASPMDLWKAGRAIRERFTDEPSTLAEAALGAFAKADAGDLPWSRRQLALARAAADRGRPFLAAAHCREALISGLLEAYGQNPCRGWVTPTGDVPPDARVRPREVAAAVLGSDEIRRLVPDLDPAWRTAGNPRARYLHIAPTQGDPGLMKAALNELGMLLKFTVAALDDGRLKAIADGIPWDAFLIRGLEAGARLAPPKDMRRGGDRRDRGPRPPREGGEGEPRPEGAPDRGPRPPREGGDRGPRPPRDGGDRGPRPPREGDRGPRPPREGGDRGPRPPRDGGDRGPRPPREVRVHGGPPRMDGPERPRQVPIGGSTEVNVVRGGLGNLGQALAAAGIAPNRKPQRDPRPPQPPAAEAPPAPPTPVEPPAPETPPASDFDVAGPSV